MSGGGPVTQEPRSLLQWMAPDLARSGLLINEEWVPGHCERACKLFPNQGVHVAATLLAAVDKRAIEYLEQAPVLALAAAYGTSARRRQDRHYIAQRFGPLVARGVKLRDVLTTYGLPLPMRKLRPYAIRPGLFLTITELAKVNPSTLSQVIPEAAGRQSQWLQTLARWSGHLKSRDRYSFALFEWAAVSLAACPELPDSVAEVADFLSEPSRFVNGRWTWQKAAAEAELWHDQIQQMMLSAKHGPAIDYEADYSPFPVEVEVHGFRFVALRSGRALITEGRKMKHCVATYLGDVMKGLSRIYSVQLDGRHMATVQLVGRKAVQVKGPCNRGPGPYVRAAVAAFVEGLPQ